MRFKPSMFAKRIMVAVLFGLLFGFVCVFMVSIKNPDIWGTPLMSIILFNRFLIGFVVGLAGLIKYHPCFGFRIPAFVRGGVMGALVSVDLAIGVYIAPILATQGSEMSVHLIFFITVFAGLIYGSIIDLIVSRIFGEGTHILTCSNK